MNVNPKILILDTGGTISQSPLSSGSLSPSNREYLSQIPRLKELATITTIKTKRVDSTEMSLEQRQEIAQLIFDNYDLFDGFVVLHGTDTMADTGAFLNYALQNIGKPIVLTGAQLPIFAPGPDGMNNVYYSVLTATLDLGEIVICFGDKIFRACQTIKKDIHSFNAYHSYRIPPLGELGVSVRLLKHRIPRNSSIKRSHIKFFKDFNSKVLYLPISSGSDIPFIDILVDNSDLKGLVLGGFGAGNIPSIHLKGVKKALNKGIPVLVASTCLRGAVDLSLYEPGAKLKDLGVHGLQDLTPIAAVQKLMYAIGTVEAKGFPLESNFIDEVYSLINQIVGEDQGID